MSGLYRVCINVTCGRFLECKESPISYGKSPAFQATRRLSHLLHGYTCFSGTSAAMGIVILFPQDFQILQLRAARSILRAFAAPP